jgi:transposase-like protein
LSLTGPDGLLKQQTKSVIEAASGEEMTEHLTYERNDPSRKGSEKVRNGTRVRRGCAAMAGANDA